MAMDDPALFQEYCIPDSVSQPGVITKIDESVIEVMIIARSACSSCHAQNFCSALESRNKIIEVKKEKYAGAKVGERVYVGVKRSMGSKAVVLAYVIPFILLLLSILVLTRIMNEGLAGLVAIGIIGIYYLIIYFFRKKLRNTFEFSISRDRPGN